MAAEPAGSAVAVHRGRRRPARRGARRSGASERAAADWQGQPVRFPRGWGRGRGRDAAPQAEPDDDEDYGWIKYLGAAGPAGDTGGAIRRRRADGRLRPRRRPRPGGLRPAAAERLTALASHGRPCRRAAGAPSRRAATMATLTPRDLAGPTAPARARAPAARWRPARRPGRRRLDPAPPRLRALVAGGAT